MDFGQWGDPNKGNGGNNGPPPPSNSGNQEQQPKSTSSSTTAEGSEMMHQFEHPGVFCDACNLNIFGFRYKCLQCADFDLCTNCERRGHHAGHVMMRIAFPEQAPEAIKRYFENQGAANDESSAEEDGGVQGPEGSRPPHGHGPHGHGHHGKFRKHPHPHHNGKKAHKKWRKLESDSSDDDTGAAAPAEAIPRVGCPYVMGKKEMKKYAKQMKKMAYLNKKAEKRANEGGNEGEKGCKRPGVDYSQCISQIQQYLNGFGIPIDVVTLYDEWGNGVATTNATQQEGAAANGNATANGAGAGAQATTTAATDLCDKLQNVRIDIPNASGNDAGAGETGRKPSDGECGGDWTMLDNQADANNQNQANTTATTATAETTSTNNLNADTTASMEPTSLDNGPVKTTWTATAPAETQASPAVPPPPPQANVQPVSIPMPWHPMQIRQLPVAPFAPLNPESVRPPHHHPMTRPMPPPPPPHHHHAPPARPAPPPHSTGNASAPPLYPRIPAFPPLMDFVHGVSSSVGSAIRNVQANLPSPVTTPTGTPAGNGTQNGVPLTPQMNATLNQLLSMGFSNHDGWLARLVQSKNGDMDAVLSALFDRGD